MSVGLFLDVDNTLTKGFIQAKFAEILRIRTKYEAIENKYQKNEINSDDFGKHIINLFNNAGFSESFANAHYKDIEQHEWVKGLLQLPATIYLVSSGPSYYIRNFAKEHEIPESNILCTEYRFDSKTGRLLGCKSVNDNTKSLFVQKHKQKHNLSIGVGDNHEKDGPFLVITDIPILTTHSNTFLSVGNLEIVTALVEKLCTGFPTPRTRPSVFLGSSTESLEIARAFHGLIDRVSDPQVWTHGIFEPSKTSIESLESSLSKFDFAVFLMTPDDTIIFREERKSVIRDNVLFEIGLFMGRLGRDRCFLIHPRAYKPKLPTDIDGLVFLEYANERIDGNWEAALTPTSNKVIKSIEKYGCRTFAY